MADHPERPRDLDKIRNTLERRAHLIVDMLEDQAQRIVDAMDEPPPGQEEPDAQTVRQMWSFTPYGARAAQAFWMIHDTALQGMLQQLQQQQGMPADQKANAIRAAHQQAEAQALQKVYPHRIPLALLGVTTPERSVQLAKQAARLVEQDQKRNPQPQPEEVMAGGY